MTDYRDHDFERPQKPKRRSLFSLETDENSPMFIDITLALIAIAGVVGWVMLLHIL